MAEGNFFITLIIETRSSEFSVSGMKGNRVCFPHIFMKPAADN